jgi:myb proto-oncogene protein
MEPEEDAKLTEAVNKHGNHCWVEDAALVSGRTNGQCRERWINIVDPVNRSKDATLTEAVNKHGNHWVELTAMVSGRTHKQCRHRWTQTLDHANRSKGKWSPEEDTKLKEAVKKHGNHWVEVAAMVPGRTNLQCRCRHRWVYSLDPHRA